MQPSSSPKCFRDLENWIEEEREETDNEDECGLGWETTKKHKWVEKHDWQNKCNT